MGASGWEYLVAYDVDVERALAALQDRLLAENAYLWDEEFYGPRPSSREQLAELRRSEEFWQEGTHTILDMDRIVPADAEDGTGTLRPMRTDELLRHLGSDRPSRIDFERAYVGNGLLADIPGWSGRFTVLFDAQRPSEIAFFGVSGD